MAVAIPVYMVGRNITLIGVRPMNVSAVGAMSFPNDVSLFNLAELNVFDSYEFEHDTEMEEIHAANSTMANNVPKFFSFTSTISEIDDADGGNALVDFYTSNKYIYAIAQATAPAWDPAMDFDINHGVPGKVLAFIGVMKSIRKTYMEGKNASSVTVLPCGIDPYWGPFNQLTYFS